MAEKYDIYTLTESYANYPAWIHNFKERIERSEELGVLEEAAQRAWYFARFMKYRAENGDVSLKGQSGRNLGSVLVSVTEALKREKGLLDDLDSLREEYLNEQPNLQGDLVNRVFDTAGAAISNAKKALEVASNANTLPKQFGTEQKCKGALTCKVLRQAGAPGGNRASLGV